MKFSPEGHGSSASHESLEDFALRTPELVQFDDFRGLMKAQMLLATAAFPDAESPMNLWVEEDPQGDSLASRFRAWVDDPERTEDDMQLNVADRARMLELLDLVRKHPPESVH